MSYHPRRSFWVTLRLDATRTQDIRLEARSYWAAWWLAGVLHPGAEIIGVRLVDRQAEA